MCDMIRRDRLDAGVSSLIIRVLGMRLSLSLLTASTLTYLYLFIDPVTLFLARKILLEDTLASIILLSKMACKYVIKFLFLLGVKLAISLFFSYYVGFLITRKKNLICLFWNFMRLDI